jgi:membrane-associated phospholipid phosphatase
VTGGLKLMFARHRPDWDPATDRPDDRRSFPSGHSTQAFEIATYASLYLRRHVFDAHRDGDEWPVHEIATYAGLYAAASAVAYERVAHNQHHVSDVAAGAALGTATSWLFFQYQERRYKNHRKRETEARITPLIGAPITGVQLGWAW